MSPVTVTGDTAARLAVFVVDIRTLEWTPAIRGQQPRRAASATGPETVGALPRHPLDSETIRRLARRALAEVDAPASTVAPREDASPVRSIALGGDHGGVRLKEALRAYLEESGFSIDDCGTHGTAAVDYPDIAAAVGRKVASGSCDVGIVVDGAGIGSCMAANKIRGVRAALCYDISSARNSREHNHANVLTLGAGLIGEGLARQIVDAWLETGWGGGRHARRVEKIIALEVAADG